VPCVSSKSKEKVGSLEKAIVAEYNGCQVLSNKKQTAASATTEGCGKNYIGTRKGLLVG